MPDRESPENDLTRANAELFELLLDWFPDIIQSVDASGNIVYVNKRACQLLGYTRDELLSMSIHQLYAPEVMANVQKGFSTLKLKGDLRVVESLVQDKQKNKIPVEIRSFAVYDKNGTFVRTFSILRDIRDIKELQNSLIHASRLAAIGELAACVAHDISNPLAVIKLYGELLNLQLQQFLDGTQEPSLLDSLGESLGNLQKSATKIEKLVNHLRTFCRSSDNEAEIVNLNAVLEDALFMVTNKIDKYKIKVVRDYDAGSAYYVRGDGSQLEQVFMNLFSNACDAMSTRSSRTLTLRLADTVPPGKPHTVECAVCDTGIGMPPEVREQIFTSFFTTKPKGEGTGLGLAIARNIVRRHGGDISLTSEPGEGTTFTVALPALCADAQEVTPHEKNA